jgi:hypothetical protein
MLMMIIDDDEEEEEEEGPSDNNNNKATALQSTDNNLQDYGQHSTSALQYSLPTNTNKLEPTRTSSMRRYLQLVLTSRSIINLNYNSHKI